ncbi:MAG: hypothetical protein ACE5FF_05130 [Saprospiraceae bacterium]
MDNSLPPGVIPKDIDLNKFIFSPSRYTWKDLDNYYRNTLPDHLGKSYYGNLRKATLQHLVDVFHMPQYAGKEDIEYYVNEMQDVKLMQPTVFMIACAALKKHGWTDKAIRDLARDRYEKNMEFINSSFENPEQVLPKLGDQMEQLHKFSKTFPSGWASN